MGAEAVRLDPWPMPEVDKMLMHLFQIEQHVIKGGSSFGPIKKPGAAPECSFEGLPDYIIDPIGYDYGVVR